MKTNILKAFHRLTLEHERNLDVYTSRSPNRINSIGEALEEYVKDLLCDTTKETDATKKDAKYKKHFSYLGNQHNPPDLIIAGGDAIEVKKAEKAGRLALNSSYPKDKLHADNPLISEACRTCEDWTVKDVFHVVGIVPNKRIQSLWFVHGACYAADRKVYERIKETISTGVSSIGGVEFAETNEVGRVNRVDPLGHTHLRIRGVWEIEGPDRAFGSLLPEQSTASFIATVVVSREKYKSFPQADRFALEQGHSRSIEVANVEIKSPNNPAKVMSAVVLRYMEK
jgi:hypothetical protein